MYVYSCKVNRVIDGDTLDLEIDLGFNIRIRERARLYGVDTPEVFGAKASPEGTTASDFTKKWVEEYTEKPGRFEYHSLKYDYKDKYGRSLGSLCHIDDKGVKTVLNEALIANGHTKK